MAVLGGLAVRLVIPSYISLPGLQATAPFSVASDLVIGAFFLPFLLRRTTVGYIGALLTALVVLVDQTSYLSLVAAAGPVPQELFLIIVPHYLFVVLLVVGSVLAWREGLAG